MLAVGELGKEAREEEGGIMKVICDLEPGALEADAEERKGVELLLGGS